MDDDAPGWDAIQTSLLTLYGDQEPAHFGSMVPWKLGGPDPLHGIGFYRASSPDHWHVVTYGFSELFAKETDDLEQSGFGFELTFRLLRKPEDKPPSWVMNFLNNISRYVFQTGNRFEAGHLVNLNGPICQGCETLIRAIVFASDPQLAPLSTPNGRVEFLQVVGITLDEQSLIKDWNTEGLLETLRRADPLLITDLDRKSVLDDPDLAGDIRERVEREGSSAEATFYEDIHWKASRWRHALELRIGATGAREVVRMLEGRLSYGREFGLVAAERWVTFQPAESSGWRVEGNELTIELTSALAEEIRTTLKPARGSYRWPGIDGLTVTVVPTEIKDQDGKVVEIVG